ncbi:chymotrypsin-like elastase family member 1.5 precursor [Danio rerio]|uniref:pancreatic elastase n=1 Tax=Danio rerio TaxID=7955 RepID=Q6DHC9_DANRE|nr:chymotrypsin-like elastase family member 1.5 precursor [Danio rerio]AAH76046.1 Zgc:92511 [Danio rerio]|eukprot:NP_001003450.1 uncharacterized protein LOC445056 precursor [Danio rerio]
MQRILLLSVLAAFALAEPRYVKDLAAEERVVGGEIAKPHSWPWQVSVQIKTLSQDSYTHYCAGTLIRKNYVLTSVHSIFSKYGSWRVVLGDHDISTDEGTEQYIEVREITFHAYSDLNDVSKGNDVALLKLASDANLNAYVQLAPLPRHKQILPHGTPCFTTGWGNTETDGSFSAELKQAYLPVVDHETCSQSDWWGSTVKDTMVCGGDGTMAVCKGDFGGPLSCLVDGKYVVYGIASFMSSEGCNIYKKPTIFTRVSAYVDWITINMNEWDYE